MTRKRETTPAPGLLETFAQEFDSLFTRWNQRECFRRYLEGLLLPAERNKTLTGLANTAPGIGAQEARAQSLQWFVSESNWNEGLVNKLRHQLIRQTAAMAPNTDGVLIIDETGDQKDGSHTAHVGRQYLGNRKPPEWMSHSETKGVQQRMGKTRCDGSKVKAVTDKHRPELFWCVRTQREIWF